VRGCSRAGPGQSLSHCKGDRNTEQQHVRQQIQEGGKRPEPDRIRKSGKGQYDEAHGKEDGGAESCALHERMADEKGCEQRQPEKDACPQEGQPEVEDEAQDCHRNASVKCRLAEQTACNGLEQTNRSDAVVRGKRYGEDNVERTRDETAEKYRRGI